MVSRFLKSSIISYLDAIIIIYDKQKFYREKKSNFHIFHIFHPFLLTLDHYNFFNFHLNKLKFGMLIPLIKFYFSYFQWCFQLSKWKKLLRKNIFKNAFFSILRGRNHGFGHIGANEGSWNFAGIYAFSLRTHCK